MVHVFHLPKDWSFDKIGHKGKIFPTEGLNKSAQFVYLEVEDGINTKLLQRECDYSYLVLEGNGYFEMEDKREECGAGDLVIIPKGTGFTYKGKMKLMLVCVPPWYPEQEITL